MQDTAAFYKQVGQNIRRARVALQKTQDELAIAVGLPRTSISNIEQGRQQILLHTLFEIARTLNAAPDDFLPRPSQPGALMAGTERKLATLADKERAFVESAMGLQKRKAAKHQRGL